MKKNIFFNLLLLLLGFLIVGCGMTKSNVLVGKWVNGNFTYTFKNDMTFTYEAGNSVMKGTYEVKGDKLSVLYKGNTESFDTTFIIEGKKLTIKDSFGEDAVYTRK